MEFAKFLFLFAADGVEPTFDQIIATEKGVRKMVRMFTLTTRNSYFWAKSMWARSFVQSGSAQKSQIKLLFRMLQHHFPLRELLLNLNNIWLNNIINFYSYV